MPRLAARGISRIETTYSSDLGTFSWSWVVRADGEVQYRLSHVDGRRERNPWRSVCHLPTAELRAICADPAADTVGAIVYHGARATLIEAHAHSPAQIFPPSHARIAGSGRAGRLQSG